MARTAIRGGFGPGLTVMLALANAAAFVAFMPLLTLLAPLRVEAVDPANKGVILSGIVLTGAVVASLANLAAGALSDRTRSRFGRRRPWMWAGMAGVLAAYPVIAGADSGLGVLVGLVLFQVAFNLFFAAMSAVLPDQVPDARKGAISGMMALGPPIGLAAAALLAGASGLGEAGRFWIVGLVFLIGAVPLMLLWPEPPGPTVPPSINETAPAGRRRRDFALAWLSRLLIQMALAASQSYLLYFIGRASADGAVLPDRPATSLVSVLVLVSTGAAVAAALAGGWISDRTGRRPLYVALSGGLVCAGMALLALHPSWTTALVAQTLYGLGVGLYTATDTALVAQILPSRADAGRDLGLFNLGNTLPQVAAPGVAIAVLAGAGLGPMGGYPALFLIAAGCALAGGLAAAFIRGVR